MPQTHTRPLSTIGDIARMLGVTPARVSYAIQTYRIEPTQRAGILRMYDETKIEAIRSALRRIESNKGDTQCGI